MAYWKSSSFTVEDNDKRSTIFAQILAGAVYQSARGRLRSIAPTFRRSCALTCPVLAAIYVHRKNVNPKKFFAELKRRKVYKVAIGYAVGGWALAQGVAQVFPVFDITNWEV